MGKQKKTFFRRSEKFGKWQLAGFDRQPLILNNLESFCETILNVSI